MGIFPCGILFQFYWIVTDGNRWRKGLTFILVLWDFNISGFQRDKFFYWILIATNLCFKNFFEKGNLVDFTIWILSRFRFAYLLFFKKIFEYGLVNELKFECGIFITLSANFSKWKLNGNGYWNFLFLDRVIVFELAIISVWFWRNWILNRISRLLFKNKPAQNWIFLQNLFSVLFIAFYAFK